MTTNLRIYDPTVHAARVLDLWERTLGDTYPITPRVFLPRAGGNPGYEPGDGMVALDGRRLVGFALAEVVRTASGVGPTGHLTALLVDPARQRQGLGGRLLAALEDRLRASGCNRVMTGGGPARFWTGVPHDLPGARAFFGRHGYTLTGTPPDMVIDLSQPYRLSPEYEASLAAAGARVEGASCADAAALLEFEAREFAGWVPGVLSLLNAGDAENVLMVRRDRTVIGSILTFTPGSRWRGPNLVWERIFGPRIGGYGAVGIAREWRGKGLGAAMSQAAAVHVQRCGATACYIDWVGPAEFYRRLGATTWRLFDHLAKPLA